jgi:serine/threonine protein phosphatase 1
VANRTFAIGDVHGDLLALKTLLVRMPQLDSEDTIVFLGDYVDRGPCSKEVVEMVRDLQKRAPMKVVTLRGNHEDGWLRVLSGGWPEFVMPPGNGCLAALRSYTGAPYKEGDRPTREELELMKTGSFFPEEVVDWLMSLGYFYEDEHAIYVHAGLLEEPVTNADGTPGPSKWRHPAETENQTLLLWVRTMKFFLEYKGKLVVVGHTTTDNLPPELDKHTPEDPADTWASDHVMVIDTGAGKGGFLTCVELPGRKTWESR